MPLERYSAVNGLWYRVPPRTKGPYKIMHCGHQCPRSFALKLICYANPQGFGKLATIRKTSKLSKDFVMPVYNRGLNSLTVSIQLTHLFLKNRE